MVSEQFIASLNMDFSRLDMKWIKQNAYLLSFAGVFACYFFNLFIDIMDVDAAQFASIAREMVEKGSYLEVYHRGKDYLDKPPLLFWLSALSFRLFGFHNWSYKLPAVLALIGAVYFTYRFAKLYYTDRVAKNAALILASCQAMMLMTNDVRTDGLLTSAVIFTIWQMAAYLKFKSNRYIILAGIGLSLALMTKGPIAAIIVAAAIGGHLLLSKNWLQIFDIKWVLLVVIALLLLVPMCYGLYTQFDLHPEKFVYGLQGPSGLKFFFWTQSFGRVTGDIYWANDTGPFYFLNTILWDFQPWVVLFFIGFGWFVLRIFQKDKPKEYITFMGFLFPFIALSASNYKLPHYIFVLLPFAAIIASDSLDRLSGKFLRLFTYVQFGLMHLYFALGGLILFYFFSEKYPIIIMVWLLGFLVFWYVFLKAHSNRFVFISVAAAISLGVVMSTSFYPHLLTYQSRSIVGKKINQLQVPQDQFYSFGEVSFALDYYARRTVPVADSSGFDSLPAKTYIFATAEGKDYIDKNAKTRFNTIEKYDDFRVTQLQIQFLKPNTRSTKLKKTYLLQKEN